MFDSSFVPLYDKYLHLVSRSTVSESCHHASLSRCRSSEVKQRNVCKQPVEGHLFSPSLIKLILLFLPPVLTTKRATGQLNKPFRVSLYV